MAFGGVRRTKLRGARDGLLRTLVLLVLQLLSLLVREA